jgi:hypothetical protein
METRTRYSESSLIIEALLHGAEPPLNSMSGWTNLRDDLDNNEDPGLDSLRNYVRNTLQTNITTPFLELTAELMRTHRANLPDYRSRDNSQVSDSMIESNSEVETNSSIYQSANSNIGSSSNSNSDLEDYQSANSNLDDLNHSDSNDNLESIQGHDEHISTEIDESINKNEFNTNSDKKLITDDAPDFSDSFHMLFSEPEPEPKLEPEPEPKPEPEPEPPIENKSTIDFVLQKQQEEMPDIIDSDGGE